MNNNAEVSVDQSTVAEFEDDLANMQEGADSARPSILLPFTGYLLYFIGIGQVAGGLVHYEIDPPLYTALAAVGIIVFLMGTVINEVVLRSPRPSARKVGRVIGTGIVVALGLGMVSGGVQHFTSFPDRSVWMIPVGLVLAYIGFVTHSPRGGLRRMLMVGALVAATAVAAFFMLAPLAESIAPVGGSGGGHHG